MIENQADHIEITSPILEQKQLRVWHMPGISRIEIKNTLNFIGSVADFSSSTIAT